MADISSLTSGFAGDDARIMFGDYRPGAFKMAGTNVFASALYDKSAEDVVRPMTKKELLAQREEQEAELLSQVKAQYGEGATVRTEKEMAKEQHSTGVAMVARREKDDAWRTWAHENRGEYLQQLRGLDDEKLGELCNLNGVVWMNPFNIETNPPSLVPGFRLAHYSRSKFANKKFFKLLMDAKKKNKESQRHILSCDWISLKIGVWYVLTINTERFENEALREAKVERQLKRWAALRMSGARDVDIMHKTGKNTRKEGVYVRLQIERFREYTRIMDEQRELQKRELYEKSKAEAGESPEGVAHFVSEYDRITKKNKALQASQATKKALASLALQKDGPFLTAAEDDEELMKTWEGERDEHGKLVPPEPGQFALPSGRGNPKAMGRCQKCLGYGVGIEYKDGYCKHCWREKLPEGEPLTDDELEFEEIDMEDVDLEDETTLEHEEFPMKFKSPEQYAVVSFLLDMDQPKHVPDCPQAAGREMIFRIYGCFTEETDAEAFRERLKDHVTNVDLHVIGMYKMFFPEMINWSMVRQEFREEPLENIRKARVEQRKKQAEFDRKMQADGGAAPVIDVTNPMESTPMGKFSVV